MRALWQTDRQIYADLEHGCARRVRGRVGPARAAAAARRVTTGDHAPPLLFPGVALLRGNCALSGVEPPSGYVWSGCGRSDLGEFAGSAAAPRIGAVAERRRQPVSRLSNTGRAPPQRA